MTSVDRVQLNTEFGTNRAFEEHEVTRAAKLVVSKSRDVGDAILLLDVLGLINPQPGNEPADSPVAIERKRQEAKIRRAVQERIRREARKKKVQAILEETGE